MESSEKKAPLVIEKPRKAWGVVSMYDTATCGGRMYLWKEARQVEFELHEDCRYDKQIALIIESLSAGASAVDKGEQREPFFLLQYARAENGDLEKVIIRDVARDMDSLSLA